MTIRKTIAFILIISAVIIVGCWVFDKNTSSGTIYRSDEDKTAILAQYGERMGSWPVPYEEKSVETTYGKAVVVICGPADAPPVILLPAYGMTSASWAGNVAELSGKYRIYIINSPGEDGLGELSGKAGYPEESEQVAGLYSEIMDSLRIERAVIVGASGGGYTALSLAIHAPGRVSALALLAPLGLRPLNGKTLLMNKLNARFSIAPLRDNMVEDFLGDDPVIKENWHPWLKLVLKGTRPAAASPKEFSREQLQSLKIPVLLFLGTRDPIVGKIEYAQRVAQRIPGLRLRIYESGHMPGLEKPREVNRELNSFIDRNSDIDPF